MISGVSESVMGVQWKVWKVGAYQIFLMIQH